MPIDYAQAKVYLIYSDLSTDEYVGSTAHDVLDKRLATHLAQLRTAKKNMKLYNHFRDIGVEHMHIALLENYPCKSYKELLIRERKWIDVIKPSLNKNRPYVTYEEERQLRKEYNRAWYARNPDKVKAYITGRDPAVQRERNDRYKAKYPERQLHSRACQYALNRAVLLERIPCTVCSKLISRTNMRVHIRNIHHQQP